MCHYCKKNYNKLAKDFATSKRMKGKVFLEISMVRDDVDGSAVINASFDDFLEAEIPIKFCPFCGEELQSGRNTND